MKSPYKVSIWVIAIAAFIAAGGVFYAQAQQFLDSNIVTVQTPSGNIDTPYVLNCVSVPGGSNISISWYGNISKPHNVVLYNDVGLQAGYPDRPIHQVNPGTSGTFVEDTGQPSGTAVSYVLKTNYPDGTLVNSNQVTCYTGVPATGPGTNVNGDAPTNLSIFARDAGTLILNWKDNVTSTRPYRFEIQRIKTNPLIDTNFDITGRQAGSVSFKWKNATGYSPYNSVLERSTSTDSGVRFSKDDFSSTSMAISPFDPLGVANPNFFTYSDNSVSEATKYFYRIKACSSIPVGGFYMRDAIGNIVLNPNKPPLACSNYTPSGTVLSTTTQPIAPSNLVTTTLSPSEIKLTWKDNSKKEEGFYVYRDGVRLPALNPSSPASLSGGTITYTDTGLGSGTSYSYSVKSFINISGGQIFSDSSNTSIATTWVTLSVAKVPSAGGSVSGSSINCGSTCSSIFSVGDGVTLTANPASASYNFTKWTGGVCNNSTSTSCAFTISADTSVTANFALAQTQTQMLTLNVSSAPSVGGSVLSNFGINCGNGGTACSADLDANTTVQLSAINAAGYAFSSWSGNACNSHNSSSNDYFASPNCAFNITGNISVTANFVSTGALRIGDVNGDGVINCADATMIVNAAVGLITLSPSQAQRADVNGDGVINSTDAQKLILDNHLNCSGIAAGTANHWYANLYDSAQSWLASQGKQLKLIGGNLWEGFVSLLGKGRQFVTENLFGADVSLGQNQPVNYDAYFNPNDFFANSNVPLRVDTGLDSNTIYLYRVRVSYTDGVAPSVSSWSDNLAGKTLDGSAGSSGSLSPVCTSNSFCDRTFMGFRVTDINGTVLEQSEAQCQVNADCKNVGRASRTLEEK